jgi:hypothetical protein
MRRRPVGATMKEKHMGMFGTLMGKIFHANATADPASAAPVQRAPNMVQREAERAAAGGGPAAGGIGAGLGSPAGTSANSVDVEAILNGMASKHGEKLDWKHSIVDMLKLVGMDSSLAARKDLAADLHYTGDTNDSAAMNMWLHKEVLKKLAENGGHVPASLLNH